MTLKNKNNGCFCIAFAPKALYLQHLNIVAAAEQWRLRKLISTLCMVVDNGNAHTVTTMTEDT